MNRGALVETSYGTLSGTRDGELYVFRGVPFAQPPTGDLRWRAPRRPLPWTGVRDATHFGPAAPQNTGDPVTVALQGEPLVCSEDCLTLNIWTPGLETARRPVMVWIHGGAFLRGAASENVFDGAALARRGDVVVVTIQYRLGALGFLYLADLGADRDAWPSNLGLRDQIAALEWVRDESAAFGGDASNVTVFGQSAGSISVGILLGAPSTRGLFQHAILHSAAPVVVSPSAATAVAETVLRTCNVGRDSLEKLRQIPVPQIIATEEPCRASPGRRPLGLPFMPVIDADLVPQHPMDSIAAGSAAEVSVIIGTTLDEMTPLLVLEPSTMSLDATSLRRRLEQLLTAAGAPRDAAAAAIEVYQRARRSRGAQAEPLDLWLAIQGDYYVRCGSMRLAEQQRRHQGRTFAYLFTFVSPFMGGILGACHSLDLPFLFGTFENPFIAHFTGAGPEIAELAHHMQDAWTAFARNGDPNTGELDAWPTYDRHRRATMLLGRDCSVVDAPLEDERQFWERLDLRWY